MARPGWGACARKHKPWYTRMCVCVPDTFGPVSKRPRDKCNLPLCQADQPLDRARVLHGRSKVLERPTGRFLSTETPPQKHRL
jgi:hypothetical protein